MSYRTAQRKPRNAVSTRKCPICGYTVCWFVPSKDDPTYTEIVKHPRFGKITKDGYYCNLHWSFVQRPA